MCYSINLLVKSGPSKANKAKSTPATKDTESPAYWAEMLYSRQLSFILGRIYHARTYFMISSHTLQHFNFLHTIFIFLFSYPALFMPESLKCIRLFFQKTRVFHELWITESDSSPLLTERSSRGELSTNWKVPPLDDFDASVTRIRLSGNNSDYSASDCLAKFR